MTTLAVSAMHATLTVGGERLPCRIGRDGACPEADKREGDGRTPAGDWPILAALLRPDRWRTTPATLPWRWLRPTDGWCDAPGDPAYNRPVILPYPVSAEALWRDDDRYDAVVILGHNLAPPKAGRGSAIFLHLAGDGPTAGCVAIAREAMAAILPMLAPGDRLAVA